MPPIHRSKSNVAAYTPWRHTSELAMVRDWFYASRFAPDPYSASTPDMRQTAIQHVQMWSFKDPKLPHAIIATANLTDAMLHDTLDRRKTISDWALRSVYAMAFCRFVNGFVDRDIAKATLRANAATNVDAGGERTTGNEGRAGVATTTSRGESSMYAHAAAIGLPEQFVDLRHRATHDEMPSLEVLRQMAQKGLDWLWERWWKLHATDDPGKALREIEGQRLLGERKGEAREAAASHERARSGDASWGHEARTRHGDCQETSAPSADVGQDDMVGTRIQYGKRNHDTYNADVDAQTIEGGRNSKGPEKLARVKIKSGPGSTFGLFEA